MKKAMAILLAAVLALACTACGGSKNGETKDRLAQIKEKGYIELCTEPYFAPFEYVDPSKSGDDQYQGMDIEVAKYIADKIGVDLKITALDFTAVLAGVADGKYDFAISAIAYAPSRAEAMRLSDVYYSTSTGYKSKRPALSSRPFHFYSSSRNRAALSMAAAAFLMGNI